MVHGRRLRVTTHEPLAGVRYRCAVCRLEVIFDTQMGRFTAAPLIEGEGEPGERPTS